MDQSHNNANGGTHYEPTGRLSLHKKRSLVRVRPTSINTQARPITTTSIYTEHADSHGTDHTNDGNRKMIGGGQRKGSIRNVVRKIFGRSRSSRLVTPVQQRATPPRHAYHRSEPHGLPTPQESAVDDQEQDTHVPQRALSTPMHIDVPGIRSPKVRSPYAVEFPKSAKLKPLEISSPFAAPSVALRRRKTLPSILIAGDDAVAIAAAAKRSELPPMPARSSAEIARQPPPREIGLAVSSVKDKRRSRSAAGMRTREDSGVASEPERKRSEEIRFWRESHQGSVLRASGFTVPLSVPPQDEQERDDKWQTTKEESQESSVHTGDLADSPQGLRITSHSRQDTLGTLDGSTQLNFRSTSGMSRDLEDRVAQLEANLQFFQRSLNKLQTDRNRRTVIVGDYSSLDPGKSYRTPSMLADDLRVPSDCMDADTEEQLRALRPATAPQPRSPIAEYPPVPPLLGQSDYDSPESPTRAGRPSTSRKPSNLVISNPSVTFKSLYQMLADERSARRRLETQMRNLHTDIQDLQQQVTSNTYSHRNSYMLSHEATRASSRLRDLLSETESSGGVSPEDTPRNPVYVSRFSGSTTAGVLEIDESEGDNVNVNGGAFYDDDDDEEVQTPHDAYKTPREEQSPFHLESERGREGDMF
jgi:hypothetical protein